MATTKPDMTLYMEAKDCLSKRTGEGPGKEIRSLLGPNTPAWMALMTPPNDGHNEVYPGILLGDYQIAKDIEGLQKVAVTHVVNCAQGKKFNQIDTDRDYFLEAGIQFLGIPAIDIMTYKIAPHFQASADFIDEALKNDGRVYVHCMSGVSRSATTVISFLMQKRQMTLMEAIKEIRGKRKIMPNDGFLKELVTLNETLYGPADKQEQT